MVNSRRAFMRRAGVASLGFVGLHAFACHPVRNPKEQAALLDYGYGPLVEDPDGILNLPRGFSYKIISRSGEAMSDGFLVPGKADGMATFAGKSGRTVLVRNHEIGPESYDEGPFGKNNERLHKLSAGQVYDFGFGKTPSLGGTTHVIYNEETQRVEEQYLSLAGTIRNCAGGPTPWNSWLTCEEDVTRRTALTEKEHGYVFEVPASGRMALPRPIEAMGRFNHEAVAVDPRTNIVYLTEDRGDSLIYRFLPEAAPNLHKGGKLQVLCFAKEKSFDTRNWENNDLPVGLEVPVHWMDIDGIDSPDDDLRLRGFEQGAACFARGEGMWYGNDEIYFACTNGGSIKSGQIFRYVPSMYEGTDREKAFPAKLSLFVEPNNDDILENCDNLTVAPWGDVITCEDKSHPHIVGITPRGKLYTFGENVGYKPEFAGSVFSPSGKTLFVNIQGPGLTFAITGPWQNVDFA